MDHDPPKLPIFGDQNKLGRKTTSNIPFNLMEIEDPFKDNFPDDTSPISKKSFMGPFFDKISYDES